MKKGFGKADVLFGDMNHKRHRDTYYINSFPCGTKCPALRARFGLTENRRVFYTS